jgi:purine-binding chemotaxis protein CheW
MTRKKKADEAKKARRKTTRRAVKRADPVEASHAVEIPPPAPATAEVKVAAPVPAVTTPVPATSAPEHEMIGDDPDSAPRRSLREAIAAREGRCDTLVFHVGPERFAIDLAAVEEAIELPSIHHLPEMPEHLLGVFELRGRLVPIYSPERVLRVALASEAAAVLVLRTRDKRLGLAVDDVDDVLTIEGAAVRRAPIPENDDSVLLGVIRRESELLALVDAESLALACLVDQLTEAA